jgi:hypothetical protein
VPHQQAGHMTAPDQCCINVKKLLSIKRRPHMTPKRSSGAFIGLAYRPSSLTARWKRGIIPPLHE